TAACDIVTGGAAPVDVGAETLVGREVFDAGFRAFVGKDEVRVTIAVEVRRCDSVSPVGGQFSAVAGAVTVGAAPVDVRGTDAGSVVDVVAEDDVRIAVVVEIGDNRASAAKRRQTSDAAVLVVLQIEEHMR